MLFKNKPQVSRPLPELGHQDPIVYLNQIIQHVEAIREGKGGITKGKAEFGLNLLLNGIVQAWDSYANLPDDLHQQKTDALMAFVVDKAGPNTPLGQWFSKKEQTQANYAELMTKFGVAPIKQKKWLDNLSQNNAFINPKKVLSSSVEHVLKQQQKIFNHFKVVFNEIKPSASSPKGPEKDNDAKIKPR